jgi:predicted acyl esterase
MVTAGSAGYAVHLVRLLPLLLLVAVLSAAAAPAGGAVDASLTKLDTTVTMSDGAKLAITFYEPAGTPPAGGWPAVMMFHGIGQTRSSLDIRNWSAKNVAETYLVPQGYAVLTFDARAHGQSGGMFTLDGPRELQDTRELFSWLTGHSEIDSKHVGAFGVSYGGGMVWLAAVEGVPFAAIATAATWTNLADALAPQGLVRSGVVYGFLSSIPADRYPPDVAALLQDALASRNVASIRSFLAQRSTRSRLGGLTVPTLMLQGRRDFAFGAEQALTAFRLLKGPKRLYLGDLGHSPAANPPEELDHYALEVRGWFDRFLKGASNGLGARPEVELAADPWNGKTATFRGLPAARTLKYSFSGGRRTLTAAGKVVRTSGRVRHLETFGTASVRVTVSSRTGYPHLVAVLSAARPDGSEIVISDGGVATAGLSSKPRTVTIRFPDEITSIPRGSKLRVTIGGTSTVQASGNLVYLNAVADASVASIGKVRLTLPVLKKPVSP